MSAPAIPLTAFAFALALFAAEPTPAPAPNPALLSPPPAEPPPPAPASIPTLARTLEGGLSRVRLIEKTVERSPATAEIEHALPEITTRMTAMEATLSGARPVDVSYRELNTMRIEWMELDDTLSRWESSLERHATELADARAELKALEETWQATLSADSQEQVPAVLVEKIDSLLLNTTALRQRLRDRAAALLLVQDEVSADRVRVNDALERVNVLSKQSRERLFEIENVPLWTALATAAPANSLSVQVAESWRTAAGETLRLLDRYRARFAFQLALFAALAAGGWFLVRWAKREAPDDASAMEAAAFLNRPVSAAAMVALFCTFWIYPPTAVQLHGAALTLLLLPYFRFLPKLSHPALLGPGYGLGALFLLDRVHDFALEHTLFSRVVLFSIGVLGIACWGWAFSNLKHTPAGQGVSRVFGRRFLIRAAMGLLVVALAANAIGNVTLSEQLTIIAVKGAFAAGLLYIVARVVQSHYALALAFMASRGAPMIRRHRELLERRGRKLIRLAAVATWVVFVLWIMRIIEQFAQILVAILKTKWTLGPHQIAVGSIVAFFTALTLGIVAARVLRFILDEAVLPKMSLPRGVPAAISTTVKYLVVSIGFVMALLAAGLEIGQFAFLAGAFGIGIGFGLQNIVNNFVSGLILLYERPIQVGDALEVGTMRGRVQRIGIRSSTLATYDGAEVIVPNASLIATDVVNWTLSSRVRRVDIAVGAAYGSDPRFVLEVLLRTARAHEGVMNRPAPMALFTRFGESSLDFELRFWTPEFDNWVQVGSDVRTAVFAAFKDAAIQIPFPQRDLHVKSVSETAGSALRERQT